MGGTLQSGELQYWYIEGTIYEYCFFTDAEMNLFRSIKKAFGPNNILNPFKMDYNWKIVKYYFKCYLAS